PLAEHAEHLEEEGAQGRVAWRLAHLLLQLLERGTGVARPQQLARVHARLFAGDSASERRRGVVLDVRHAVPATDLFRHERAVRILRAVVDLQPAIFERDGLLRTLVVM